MFSPVDKNLDFPKMERKILEFWEKHQIFEKSLSSASGKDFVFYDGPPFATGLPHYGHLLAGTLKDIVPRYWAMQGYRVERRFGWDCHGLPVENEVEKELGLSGRRDIENYGVAEFNEKCRSIVLRYTQEWEKTVKRMGRWVDFVHDYKTMDLDYMESIWWVFKTIWDKGLIYEGHKVQPICPRCGTPLSNFEVNLGPQEKDKNGKSGHKRLQDPSLTIRFKALDEKNTFFYAWTTTPWTLPSNLALAVGAEIVYTKIKTTQNEVAYLAKERLSDYFPDAQSYKVLEELPGKNLVGRRYEPLFPYFKETPNAFRVLSADYVTLGDGTAIVHQAPAFGEDDYQTCQTAGIGLVNPVTINGIFEKEVSDFEGRFCKEADKDIIKYLKEAGKVVKQDTLVHAYPHCYRCESPLIYKAISTWFMKIDPLKDRLIENNLSIHWVPETIKEGRFGNWLKNARDWNLSRNRYWGNPLPVWKCSNNQCDHRVCLGSREELEKRTGQKVQDLHKHFIDKLTFPCPQCQQTMVRIPEVLDCWFESGAMPYAQCHYPFENKELFEKNFPADFIAEGLDQTRGWFYTLLVLSTALFDKPAFKMLS
jgi:isoleucyl-tRNA synthetase